MEFVFDLQIKNGIGTPLHAAASKGDFLSIKRLVNTGIFVDNVANLGVSPLQIAVHKGFIEIVKYLLDNGADVNLKDISNFTSGRRPLHFAIATCNERMVNLLLKYKPCVEARDSANKTPLYMAVQNRCCNIIKALIKSGASVNTPISNKCTCVRHVSPLCVAVINHDIEVLKILIRNGGNVNAHCNNYTKKGFSLLHLAAKLAHYNITKYLIDHGANVNAKDFHGKMPICYAIESGCMKVYELILRRGGNIVNSSEMIPNAAENGSKEIMEDLLRRNANINTQNQNGRTALHISIRKGHVELSKFLLNNHIQFDIGDKFNIKPIHEASKLGLAEIVNLLLELGTFPNDVGRELGKGRYTPLHYAVQSGNETTIRLLLDYGAEVNVINTAGETPLCLAAQNSSLGIVKLLLDRGANINLAGISKLKDSAHPLYFAVKENLEDMVKLLLCRGACVNTATKNGETILHIAVKKSYENVVNMLLEYGATVNFSSYRRTPLYTAVLKRNRKITEMLLNYGASVNTKDRTIGESLLHLAARRGRVCIVDEILKHGAEVNLRNKHGATALHIAVEENHKLIVKKLLDYGANVDIKDYEGTTALCYVDLEKLFFGIKESISFIIKKHIVKLKAANIDKTDEHLDMIKSDSFLSAYLEKCEAEILNMMSERLGGNVSYYDILTKPIKRLAAYLKNENVYKALNMFDFPLKYPIYSSILECKHERAKFAKELHEKGTNCLNLLTRHSLPNEIIAEIMDYLDVNEMRNFCRVVE